MTEWGTEKEIETRRRIRLSVWAYAYEYRAHSIVPDHTFDFESYCVDLRIDTDRLDLDYWFRAEFEPATGMWIRKHPELEKVGQLYDWIHTPNPTFKDLNERFGICLKNMA